MNFPKPIFAVLLFSLAACASPSRETTPEADTPVALKPNAAVNATTSYQRLFDTARLYTQRLPMARAFLSVTNNGRDDLLTADLTGTTTPTPVNFFWRLATGDLVADTDLFGTTTPTLVHPRKAIVADLNNDGFSDVVVTGHGYDQNPFPGEVPLLLLNDQHGHLGTSRPPVTAGFYHSVCAGDVTGDGYPDLFLTNSTGSHGFLINDGTGHFTFDTTRFPTELQGLPYFTSELYDLNADGYLDLVISGHEFDGAVTRILWGNGTGRFTLAQSQALPGVADYGVAIGLSLADVNGDGFVDLLVNRTGDGKGTVPFYQGYHLQLIDGKTFQDVTASRLTGGENATASWLVWLRFFDQTGDGKLDIVVDDTSSGLVWTGNGAGTFGLKI